MCLFIASSPHTQPSYPLSISNTSAALAPPAAFRSTARPRCTPRRSLRLVLLRTRRWRSREEKPRGCNERSISFAIQETEFERERSYANTIMSNVAGLEGIKLGLVRDWYIISQGTLRQGRARSAMGRNEGGFQLMSTVFWRRIWKGEEYQETNSR